jgi:hypothetical protein
VCQHSFRACVCAVHLCCRRHHQSDRRSSRRVCWPACPVPAVQLCHPQDQHR